MSTSTAAIRLPLRSYPGINPFVLDWLGSEPRATRFLPRVALAEVNARGAREVDPSLAAALVESNARWGIDATAAVPAWASGAMTFIAGQQVGIGGGPLYTLAKIASLVKMKREVESRGGAAVAFFWLATEDHDWDEAATLEIPASAIRSAQNPNGLDAGKDLVTVRAPRRDSERRAIGPLPIPDALRRDLDALLDLGSPQWLRDGISFGDSFAELIASVFANEVVLVDALLPELRRAGGGLLHAIASRKNEAQKALAERAEELRKAGYREQVTARGEDYTLLFEVTSDGVRRPLEIASKTAPEAISTSALTRPLLQDAVLAPDVFVGGPAEVAYYAQVSVLHELLGVRRPKVALRGHALVAPFRQLRNAEKHGLPIDRAFGTPEAMIEPSERAAVEELNGVVEKAGKDLLSAVDRVAELALPAEHALAGRIQRSVGHLEYHLEKLRERSVRALLRREQERFDAARKLVATLCPDGHVQDRVVSWLALWSRYGQDLVDRMIEEIEPNSSTFNVISI